jgi:hypothetical protein
MRQSRVTLAPMRRAALIVASVVLLVGPTLLALFSGGFYDGPRSAATLMVWALVLLLAVAGPLPLPRTTAGWLAVGGLAALLVWTAASAAWAPLIGAVVDNVQRLLLYLGALLASIGLLRHSQAARAVEPALALGAAFVLLYGLSERLLPGVVNFEGSFIATGRLELPITYYNAQGLLAAMGLVLSIRLAGDESRPSWLRPAAAAACAPLGLGIFLSYSRGALAVAALGLIVLLAAAPTWSQLRSAAVGVLAAVITSAAAAALPGVASLEGIASEQQRDGAIMLVCLVVLVSCAALVMRRVVAGERGGSLRVGGVRSGRHLPAVAAVAVSLCVAGLIGGGLLERADASDRGATPSRLASLQSLRYEYWGVGLAAFAEKPLLGHGSGSFRVFWRQERPVNAGAVNVHSLVLEQAAELGIPGLVFLGCFILGVAVSSRRALRNGASIAAGASAACVVWVLHASIDWDWQVPAVTLPAVILAGALIAAAERRSAAPSPGRAADRHVKGVRVPA